MAIEAAGVVADPDVRQLSDTCAAAVSRVSERCRANGGWI